MASTNTAQIGPANRDLLATLRKVYGGGHLQRDTFGRRMALPCEVARALAEAGTAAELPVAWPQMPTPVHTFRPSVQESEER